MHNSKPLNTNKIKPVLNIKRFVKKQEPQIEITPVGEESSEDGFEK
jgi:hypothetical protein